MQLPRIRRTTHATVIAYIALATGGLALGAGATAATQAQPTPKAAVTTKVVKKVSDTTEVRVKCPKGFKATGGGFNNPGATLISQPLIKNGSPIGWIIQAAAGNTAYKSVYAVCQKG